MDLSKASAAAQVLEQLQTRSQKGEDLMPDFLFVVGDSREDEVVFRWANKLGTDKVIRDVHTISLGSRNTEAVSTLTQGVTGKQDITFYAEL